VNAAFDTNHRWLVWFQPIVGDARVVGAFDDRPIAEAWASQNARRTVREHIAWLPTTTLRVLRGDLPVRVCQMYPPEGEILVSGSKPAGRGLVVEVGASEFLVAVPVLPPGVGEGPSLWEIGRAFSGPVQ
jgi:hypothetical protein